MLFISCGGDIPGFFINQVLGRLKKAIPVSSLSVVVLSYHIHAIVLNKIREIFPGFFSILKTGDTSLWRGDFGLDSS